MIQYIVFPIILLSIPLNFQNQDLHGKDLQSANLIKANLEGANLTHVDAKHANFTEANLNKADLSYGNFQYALFEKASLVDVIAKDADFRCSEGLSAETRHNLEQQGARFDCTTLVE